MERLFEDMWAEWERERGRPGARFWAGIARDALGEALEEWASRFGRAARSLLGPSSAEPVAVLAGDVRFALRQLARQPVHAGSIVLLMALGIAGNAAVFRVFNGLFLKPLPFDRAERLVALDETAPQWNLESVSVAIDDFRIWETSNRTFAAMTAYSDRGGNLALDGSARRVSYIEATHHIDDVLGLEPLHGRFFTEEEDQPGAPRVALLGSAFWEEAFGADPGVIGRPVRLDGVSVEIIGVLPPEARFLGPAELWMPLREDDSSSYYLVGLGRLLPGATVEGAREDLLALHKARVQERAENAITSPIVVPLRDAYLGDRRLGAGFLLGAVAIVLLIACGNIAGLMFARAVARTDEMIVRRALGAGRSRLVRQLLTESLLLAALGAGLGAGLGVWGSGRLVAAMSDQFPPWAAFDLDVRFLAFTVLATVAAAVAFGLAPALQASRADAASVASTRSTASRSTRRAMSALVVAEVALAVTLLIVSGLTVADLRALTRLDPGYRTDGIVTYRVELPSEQYPERHDRLAFAETYVSELEAIPGVASASLASILPLGGHSGWFFEIEGGEIAPTDNAVVLRRWVSPGYLEAMGVRLVEGRVFDELDGRDEGSLVIVVNESLVRTHVPAGTDAVGQRIRTSEHSPWYTIIGVTADVKHYGVDEDTRPGTYEPMAQNPLSSIQVALSATGDFGAVTAAVRTATEALDPELPLYDVRTLAETLDEALLARRASSWLVGAFSAVALMLALAGVYGVISYSVGRRAHEISIRIAMGARGSRVMRDVVRQGMVLVGTGAVIGLALARAGAGLVSGVLVGVSATSPSVYLAVTALVLAVAALANYLPARRAAGIHPMQALRGD